jgi:hypothetical protein
LPGIFISYRRQDSSGHAGRIYDALSRRFGAEQVFLDVGIEPGVDFVDQIDDAVGSCRLLVVVIGPHWTTMEDAKGRRRLDDPADLIRVEVEAGLRRPDVRVVPVLVQGARMPTAEELPPSLAGLTRRNALELSDGRWNYDVDRLISTVDRVLGAPHPPEWGFEPAHAAGTPEHTGAGQGRVERHAIPGAPAHRAHERAGSAGWVGRHWRLAITVVVLAIAAGVAAVIVASQSGSSPSPPPGESEIYRDTKSSVSADGIELSNLLATSERKPLTIGGVIKIGFSLKNVGHEPITFVATYIAARDPGGANKDFAEENQRRELAPGEVVERSATTVVDVRGPWEFWPCYQLTRGGECPDEWRSFQVYVGQ